jgi:PEGA domain-containing protein
MGRYARILLLVFACAGVTGCVERRFIVESNPPGAIVYKDGVYIGATPVEIPFTYYGDHDFELMKEGYETRKYQVRVRPPWFERIPIDFFSENLWPLHIQDNRRIPLELQPQLQPRTDDLLNNARNLRERGQAIPAPVPAREAGAPVTPPLTSP